MSASPRRSLAALVLGAVLIGLAPIFVRLADVGPTAVAFWRMALPLPLFVLLGWLRAGAGPRTRPEPGRTARIGWLGLAGLFFAADLALWHQSIRLTSVANATLLANLAPVFVTAAAFGLFGERHGRGFLAGLVLALAGAALLVADSLRIGPDTVLGDALGIATAAFYAGYLLTVSRRRRHSSAIEVMLWTSVAAALVLLPLALALGEPLWPRSLRGWLVLLGLAYVSHAAGQGLIAWALAHLPAAFSSVSLLVQPVAAAGFAWLLLAEGFGAQQALGGAIVLAGILLCRLALFARPA